MPFSTLGEATSGCVDARADKDVARCKHSFTSYMVDINERLLVFFIHNSVLITVSP